MESDNAEYSEDDCYVDDDAEFYGSPDGTAENEDY